MEPLRKNVALAIDGGGIRGAIAAKALAVVEEAEGIAFSQRARLTAGTSTGSIIAAGLSVGLPAARIHELYHKLAAEIFPRSWRTLPIWPLITPYRYDNGPLEAALKRELGAERKMGDLWDGAFNRDLVIVLQDLVENRARFVKPWKDAYRNWPVWEAVLASCTVPTYFPVFKGRYIDGGIGSYGNPCYVAAFEATFCLEDWRPEETTLISLGTGSTGTSGLKEGEANRFRVWNWIGPMLDAFTVDAARQQVRLVHRLFKEGKDLDFRRFQVKLEASIPMDDTAHMDELTGYGAKLGEKILHDDWEEDEPFGTVVMG